MAKPPKKDDAALVPHLIREIEENMRENDFQRDFFESISHQWERRGNLSDKQILALNRIYERVTKYAP